MFDKFVASSDVFNYVEMLKDGGLYLRYDPETELRAIIAIDSTRRGPALGGCRFLPYETTNDALYDAIRLAKGMTQKSAITQLPLGGGKTVIIKPKQAINRQALLESFGRMVNELNGKYITAMDSGTSLEDMDVVAKVTPFVASVSNVAGFPTGDPSPFTAFGVSRGIEAAIHCHFEQDSLQDVHVAIQGVGHVGYHLAKYLSELGAQITVSDVNKDMAKRCADQFNASVVDCAEIHKVSADVFAPCALGAVINDDTVNDIQAKIIAGCANNQLAEQKHGDLLHKRGILYAPDYAINAGGLIYATEQYYRTSEEIAWSKVSKIYDTMMQLFTRAKSENKATHAVAFAMAQEILEDS